MSMHEAASEALAAQKQRSLKNTRERLELAVRRIVNGNPQVVKEGTKLTAASVAKEARVDRVTLYRFHEPVLSEIRRINDTAPRALLKETRSERAQAEAKQKENLKLAEDAQNDVKAAARVNYRLDARLKELEELLRIRDTLIQDLHQQLNPKRNAPR